MSSFEEVNEIDEPESKESFVEVRPVQSHRTQLHPQEVTESGATDSTPAYLDREDGFIPGSPAIDDDKDVSSSVENIIPPQMVKGFGMFFNWAKQTATATAVLVKEKAKEINESETMRDFKEKTSEVVAQAAEATAPIWTTCAHAAESASEQAVLAAEKMQPTFDSVSNSIAESASHGWQSISDTASKWMDVEPDDSESHGTVETTIERDGDAPPSKGPMVL